MEGENRESKTALTLNTYDLNCIQNPKRRNDATVKRNYDLIKMKQTADRKEIQRPRFLFVLFIVSNVEQD